MDDNEKQMKAHTKKMVVSALGKKVLRKTPSAMRNQIVDQEPNMDQVKSDASNNSN